MYSDEASDDLGQVLLNQGIIAKKDLDEAKTYAKNINQDLAMVLIEIGKLTEETIAFAISNELGLPFMEIIPDMVDREKLQFFPAETLWRCRALPLFQNDEIIIVMSNPLDMNTRNELLELFNETDNVNFAIATTSSIMEVLKICFQSYSLNASVQNLDSPSKPADDPGAVLFVTRHINEAHNLMAEEIDFKPCPKELIISYRIAGKIEQQESVPVTFCSSIAQHFKGLAGILDATKEIYQKKFFANVQGQSTPLRLTLIRTNLGERIIIGFENTSSQFNIKDLVNYSFNKEELQRILSLPQGLFLLANPDIHEIRKLSHIFLNEFASQQKKVMSLEIGITSTLQDVIQIDLSNSRFVWENILEDRPDIVYIEGTVPTQLWPYLSGPRLIFLSIPATSSIDTLCFAMRQIPEILLSHILRGILVFSHNKLLCSECCRPSIIPELLFQFEPSLGDTPTMKPIGCSACRNSGYQGEIYLTDIIWADKLLRELLANSPSRYDMANNLGDFGNSILTQIINLIQEGRIPIQDIWLWV